MADRSFRLFPTPDGQSPVVHCWSGSDSPRGSIVIAHGMGEHALRYAGLADDLVQEGYIVYANDHRGHGQTVKDVSPLGDYGPEGWQGLIDDQREVLRRVREEHDVPLLLLGHSMGSMVVQHLITEVSDLMDGAALSRTTAIDVMAAATAQNSAEDADAGGERDLFASFNAAFEPVCTESDWLSRDPDQVDLYVGDPLCGFTVSEDSIASLMEAGITDVILKLYSEARHEVFNETNRAEVVGDFIAFANRVNENSAANNSAENAAKGASE